MFRKTFEIASRQAGILLSSRKKCLAASKCRLSEVTRPNNGISRHIGGSKSTIDHYLDLVNDY